MSRCRGVPRCSPSPTHPTPLYSTLVGPLWPPSAQLLPVLLFHHSCAPLSDLRCCPVAGVVVVVVVVVVPWTSPSPLFPPSKHLLFFLCACLVCFICRPPVRFPPSAAARSVTRPRAIAHCSLLLPFPSPPGPVASRVYGAVRRVCHEHKKRRVFVSPGSPRHARTDGPAQAHEHGAATTRRRVVEGEAEGKSCVTVKPRR